MSVTITRGNTDATLDKIAVALNKYELDHPEAQIDIYRRDAWSIRIRIVNPDFASTERFDRIDQVWEYLNNFADDAQCDISMLLLLTPDEMPTSMGNLEFEDPSPSEL